ITGPTNANDPAPIRPKTGRHRSRNAHQPPFRTIPFPGADGAASQSGAPFAVSPVEKFTEKRKFLAKRQAKADQGAWYHDEGAPVDTERRRTMTTMPAKTFGDRVVHNARVDAETMDVVSDTIFVTDVTEAKEG
uniref:Uncharacterized protein n=1 Tax=Romanomermis culicivorax TaxID=13658 RepID=A0A915KNJ9_ROMCU